MIRISKARKWKTYLFWIVFVEIIGGISGWLIRDGIKLYNAAVTKPLLSPPSILFPIVWGILYAIMGIGMARVYMARDSHERIQAMLIFFIQLAFNFLWSIIFFNGQRFGLALLWLFLLWILIILMIILFSRVDAAAGRMQIFYFLWVSFAAYLNYGVWRLN